MRIGIFPGSFNPIHITHVKLCLSLIEKGVLDKIILTPAGDGYEKAGLLPGIERCKLIDMAISEYSDILCVSSIEVDNHKMYTYETLDYFSKIYPEDEIVLLIGADNLKEIYWWERHDYLLTAYPIIVFARGGMTMDDFPEYKDNKNISYFEYDFPISATMIRDSIHTKDYSCARANLHKDVLEYILKNKYYE